METTDIPVTGIYKAWQADDGETVELVVTLRDGHPAAIQFPYRLVLDAIEMLHHGLRLAEDKRVAKFGKRDQNPMSSGVPIQKLVNFTIERAVNAETNATDVLLQIATRNGTIMSLAITTELADLLAKRLQESHRS